MNNELPPDMALFTLYVNKKGEGAELAEEFDVVAPTLVPDHRYLAAIVIETAKDLLLETYGSEVQVVGIVNQTAEYVVFDSRQEPMRPIPVAITERLRAVMERPYDALIDLCLDGGHEYFTWLTQDSAREFNRNFLQEG